MYSGAFYLRVYRITGRGREALGDTLLATPARHRVRSEFMALLYFADLLPRERLAAVLDERERDIAALIDHIDGLLADSGCPPTQRAVAECGRATLVAQREHLRVHRDSLLALASPQDAAGATREVSRA